MNAELLADMPNYASAKFPSLRPFQPLAHGKLRDGRRAGHRCQMLMAPTGGGKTLIGMLVASEALKKGKRVIFVCDRTTLINQTSEAADRYGLSAHGVIQANHWRFNPSLPFQIASAQTLARRSWPDADVIIIDEAHTQLSAWTEHIPTCSASVIGLSATPFSPGLGKLFTNLINATTMHDLTETGVLVPMKVLSCTQANMDGAATIGGEWSDGAAAERGMQIVGDVVSEWIRFGEGRKTIVFGATIAHCEELCQQFTGAGVMAAVFSSRTTDAERKVLLAEYRKPDSSLRVLISVEALAKGFDVPDVGCVVDCRPLRKSLSTAIQMWGRGLRSSPETGKTDCLLLDHSGNIIRFLDDFTGIFYNGLDALDMGEKLDKTIRKEPREKEIVACPSCGYKPFGKRCMSCGFEAKSAALVEAVPGEMQAVVLGKKKLADDKAHLYAQLCSYARAHSVPEKQAARAAYLFKDITGGWPPHSFRFESTENIPIERNTLNKIKSLNIAHSRGRAAHA
ncbi:MAG: DEAD/DEAH box helicase family protein [Burkholderia gladioli]